MVTVYSVLTCYGTRQKVFMSAYRANWYYNKLVADMEDRDLVEIHRHSVSQAEFNAMDFDD